MEANRSSKRRGGFTKSKLLMSFYRGAKPSMKSNSSLQNSHHDQFVANHHHHHHHHQPIKPPSHVGLIIVNNQMADQVVFPPQKPKVAFHVVPESRNIVESYHKLDNLCAAEDEAIDAKAATYISTVRERFRLERINSERNNNILQDMNL